MEFPLQLINNTVEQNASNVAVEASYNPCAFESPATLRFVLVAVLGTSMSVISIFENILLLLVWVGNPDRRQSHYYYLIMLAVFDVMVAVTYILLFSINVIMDQWQIIWMTRMWYAYMVPMLTTGHVAVTASSFLIVAATCERTLITTRSRRYAKVARDWRRTIVLVVIVMAVVSKGPIGFEVETYKNGDCTGMMAQAARLTQLAMNEFYNRVFRFWYRNLITVLLPFLICFALNIQIVRVLRRYQRSAKLFRMAGSTHKVHVRAATRMLALIVLTYLLANILDVIVTAWEFIDTAGLRRSFQQFYIYSADIISLLRVVACALRLPIYVSCNAQVRHDLVPLFRSFSLKPDLQNSTTFVFDRNTDNFIRNGGVAGRSSSGAGGGCNNTRSNNNNNGTTTANNNNNNVSDGSYACDEDRWSEAQSLKMHGTPKLGTMFDHVAMAVVFHKESGGTGVAEEMIVPLDTDVQL